MSVDEETFRKGEHGKGQEKFYPTVRWIFNSLMIGGAILGWFIFGGIGKIQDTWRHQGPGIVWYGDYDWDEQVSEKQYKRYHYTMGGFGLIVGLGLWITIANGAKKEAVERAANKDYLDAKNKTNAVYWAAFARVMGAAAYQAVATEAMKDPDYQAAKTTEEAKYIIYHVASKAAKRDE